MPHRFVRRAALRFPVLSALVLLLAVGLPPQVACGQALPIDDGSWTLAILPDTQVYAESFPQHFDAQTQWIADHAESHNIRYVLHEGDITNRNTVAQWDNAFASMSTLNGIVPYAMAPGNHDYGPGGNGATRDSLFNTAEYFGPGSYYANQSTIGGFFEAGKTDNSWHTFSAGNQDWLVLALEWGPRDEVVNWAGQVVEDHPQHQVMLVTHAYMYYDETIYDWATKGPSQRWNPHSYGINNIGTVNDGQELWDGLVSEHANFRMTFNGHVLNDGTGFRSTLGDNGNPVHQMLANYQMNQQGGMGDMRLLEFKADGNTVEVRTYSPVLDRYDTSYDQQFTLRLDELHPPLTPPPPPLIPNAVAANILVTGPTDPGGNTVDSVSIPQTSSPPFSTLQVNRGDYEIAIDGQGLNYQHGVLLATVRENEREGYHATVEVGRSSFGTDVLALSVMEAGNPGNNELNVNTSVAWFQFAAGWQAAHVNGDGTIAPGAANRVDQSMLTRQTTGRYTLDLGVDSQDDGLLFAVGNNNSNTVVQTAVLDSGDGWDIRVQSSARDFSGAGDDRDFSFVYLPLATENLTAGRFNGANGVNQSQAGSFNLSRNGVGQYELEIDGENPESGMLLLSVAHLASSGGIEAPDDNALSYSPSPSGTFLIESRDLPSGALQDTSFAWAFIDFDEPITSLFTGLEAVIDRTDGSIELVNNGAAFEIDYYELSSPGGSLNATIGAGDGEWTSINSTEGDAPGAGWDEAGGASSTAIGELYLNGSATIDGNSTIGLGEAYNNSINAEDVVLKYRLASSGLIMEVAARYIGTVPTGLAGDYNGDGKVDAADYTVWRDNLGSTTANLPGDATPDMVDASDYQVWRSNFGRTTPQQSLGSDQIPESDSCVLLLGVSLAIVLARL